MFETPFYQARRPLSRFVRAMEKGEVRIGFLGGSITDPRSNDRWSDMVIYELCSLYPDVKIRVSNSAIGATDSLHAVMRVEQDVLRHDCDLVFIEYAVNDGGLGYDMYQRSREGLIRKLWKSGCDLAITYTYDHGMQKDMMVKRLPESIVGFEKLAEHYQIPSVFMSSYALDCVKKGLLRWEEWLPDGLHPANCGSRYYARPVLDLLRSELARREAAWDRTMPAALEENNLETCFRLPFEEVELTGYWFERRPLDLALVYNMLSTFAPGSGLKFAFEGTGAVMCVDFGMAAADFMYRVDGGEWKCSNWERPVWFNLDRGWTRNFILADGLEKARHEIEITVCAPLSAEIKGCNLDICYIGIAAD